jgi:hypothetical protein
VNGRWKWKGGKTPYALSFPLHSRISAGWPPMCVFVTVNEARRNLATSIATRTTGTTYWYRIWGFSWQCNYKWRYYELLRRVVLWLHDNVSEEHTATIFKIEIRSPWRWKQYVSPKRWHIDKILHDITSQISSLIDNFWCRYETSSGNVSNPWPSL